MPPDTLSIRAWMPEDVLSTAAVARLSLPLDLMTPALYAEKTDGDPYFNLDCSFVAIRDRGYIGCVPCSTPPGEERMAYIKLFCVHPLHRRQGVATKLFDAVEAALQRAGRDTVRLLAQPANYLMPGIDVRYTPAICFVEQRGYRRAAMHHNMRVDLARRFDATERIARLEAAGLTLRRAEVRDEARVMAFLGAHWPGWQYEVSRTFRNPVPTTFLVRDGERIVGFASYEGNNTGSGWFGPMGTDPVYEGRGIGSACLLACLEALREMGYRHATIPWVGPVAFYCRTCDATIDRVFWTYEKNLSSGQ